MVCGCFGGLWEFWWFVRGLVVCGGFGGLWVLVEIFVCRDSFMRKGGGGGGGGRGRGVRGFKVSLVAVHW